ncbi:MAG TPA: hypothetical protein VLS86_08125 [Acidimicrobiia bacterium]|nr:hypothetical protein [Acidimicrobiia bacterium]
MRDGWIQQNALVRRVVVLGLMMLVACNSDVSPQRAFCDQAVPLLSQEDMGQEPEEAVISQMEELARIAEVLPEEQQGPLMVLIEDLNEQLRLWGQGRSEDGWSSLDVVEYVGAQCLRDDLTWWMVTP